MPGNSLPNDMVLLECHLTSRKTMKVLDSSQETHSQVGCAHRRFGVNMQEGLSKKSEQHQIKV